MNEYENQNGGLESTASLYYGTLKTNRSLLKYIFLSLITFGIYGIVVMCTVTDDVNTVASRYDGKTTMNFLVVYLLLSGLTFGLAPIVWLYRITNRIGRELRRRGIAYSFGAVDFWIWYVLGTFVFIGPFVYMYKFLKAVNLMCADFNQRG